MSGEARCPHCDAHVASDWAMCGMCGQRLETPDTTVPAATAACSSTPHPAPEHVTPPRPARRRVFARLMWTLLVALMLAGYVTFALWLVPRALALDTAVRFVQALTARQDSYNYQRLSKEASAAERSARFEAESALVRHDLATRGFATIDLSAARIRVTAQGALVLTGEIDGRPTQMELSVKRNGATHASVRLQMAGAEAAGLPVEVRLSGGFTTWKVDGFSIDGKLALGVGASNG